MAFHCLFDTAFGTCAVAWTAAGISRVLLPEDDVDALAARLAARPGSRLSKPDAPVAEAIGGMVRLLAGQDADLSAIRLDLVRVPAFDRRVYEVARAIPRGHTLTYGEVARKLGEPRAAQAVGQALGRNPVPIIVPCHRVLAANGRWGGFSAPGGVGTKRRLLAVEGACAPPAPDLFGNPADGRA